jgi:hypothetical protein
MALRQIWHSVRVNLRLHIAHPLGYAAVVLLIVWAASVPSIGVRRSDLAGMEQKLGYQPLSSSRLAGLGAAQVASGFMTLFGVALLINNLDRERENGLDEVFASLPIPGWKLIGQQYVGNVATLLFFATLSYVVALIAFSFRGAGALSAVEFSWPSVLFPLGSACLLASLPLFLDVLHVHHAARWIAYGVSAVVLNLGPFALAAMTHLDHPRHPLFYGWLVADLGLDTIGVWYLQGYLNLVLQSVEQLGTPTIPPRPYWVALVLPRLIAVALGLLLAAFAAWRFDRFQIAPER